MGLQKYFANKPQQFWKEGIIRLSKRWKKMMKNTFSNYKHHRNAPPGIFCKQANKFEKREYNKAWKKMTKSKTNIHSYQEKKRNLWNILIETHFEYFANKFWKEGIMKRDGKR